MSLNGLEKWRPGGEYERAANRAFEAFERGDYDRSWRITQALIGPPFPRASLGPLLFLLCLLALLVSR